MHSRNLRAIGQSIELAHIEIFELEKHGQFYSVRSRFMTPDRRSIIEVSLLESFKDDLWDTDGSNGFVSEGEQDCIRYDPRMISCLNGQGQKKRRHYLPAAVQQNRRPSQYLRTLGEHLDKAQVRTFKISWDYPKSVSVTYLTPDERNEEKIFSFDKLHDLGFHLKLRRSRRV